MMSPRSVDATFKAEKSKKENQPIFLYTIYDYDGSGSNLYFAEYDVNVTFNGQVYTKFPISHDSVGENLEGTIDTIKITLANVSRVIESYLQDYDIRGKKVSIKLVWANQLDDPDAYLEDVMYVDSYTSNQDQVQLSLSSKFDVLNVELPARRYSRNFCSWKFKSTECGYSGAESSCNKTKSRCKELNNYNRFGAFPSVPTSRIYVM